MRVQTEKMFLFIVAVLTVLIFILLLPIIQELIHWFLPVGVLIRVSKLDVDYDTSLDFP